MIIRIEVFTNLLLNTYLFYIFNLLWFVYFIFWMHSSILYFNYPLSIFFIYYNETYYFIFIKLFLSYVVKKIVFHKIMNVIYFLWKIDYIFHKYSFGAILLGKSLNLKSHHFLKKFFFTSFKRKPFLKLFIWF